MIVDQEDCHFKFLIQNWHAQIIRDQNMKEYFFLLELCVQWEVCKDMSFLDPKSIHVKWDAMYKLILLLWAT